MNNLTNVIVYNAIDGIISSGILSNKNCVTLCVNIGNKQLAEDIELNLEPLDLRLQLLDAEIRQLNCF